MANRDPEPESTREQFSPEYLERRAKGLPMAPAVPVRGVAAKKATFTTTTSSTLPLAHLFDADVEVAHREMQAKSPAVGRILSAEEVEAKKEADRRSALTSEERAAEDRAKGTR